MENKEKLVVNVDAATNVVSGQFGLGIIVTNLLGEVVVARATPWLYLVLVPIVESLANKWGFITTFTTSKKPLESRTSAKRLLFFFYLKITIILK